MNSSAYLGAHSLFSLRVSLCHLGPLLALELQLDRARWPSAPLPRYRVSGFGGLQLV